MQQVFKGLSASAVPLVHAVRNRLLELVQNESDMLMIDSAIFATMCVMAVLLWCCLLRRMQDMTLQLLLAVFMFYLALISTHIVLTLAELLSAEHPEYAQHVVEQGRSMLTELWWPKATNAS
jgi:FtsH-binding integral membrane protein